jgi:hypothetical protein
MAKKNLELNIFDRVTVGHFQCASLPDQKFHISYYIGGRLACMGGARGYPYMAAAMLQRICAGAWALVRGPVTMGGVAAERT